MGPKLIELFKFVFEVKGGLGLNIVRSLQITIYV